MTDFNVGDWVLVSGQISGFNSDGEYDVTYESGDHGWHHSTDLRPDTGGRDLTAQDVADALDQHSDAGSLLGYHVAAYLTRIARGDAGCARALSSSAGDVEPGSPVDLWCSCSYPVHNRGERAECPPSPAAGPRTGDTAPPTDVRAQLVENLFDVALTCMDLDRDDAEGEPLTGPEDNVWAGAQRLRRGLRELDGDGVRAELWERLTRGLAAAGPRAGDTAPPAAAPKAWVTREQDCHDLSCRFAASTHTHNDPRAVAGPRADDTAPGGELPGADDVEREAQQYAADCEGYEVEVAAAWRDGYNAAEERWIAAANESARLDVLDNDRLRSEAAALRDAGNESDDVLGALLRELAPIPWGLHEDVTAARDRWRSAAGEATT